MIIFEMEMLITRIFQYILYIYIVITLYFINKYKY